MELANVEEHPERKDKFEAFKERHKGIIEAWQKSHPEAPQPPIWWDEANQTFKWITRRERRALKR
jgi:hypothetical protein